MFSPSLASVFIAGIFTFLAPCTLPLVPAYIGYLAGVQTHDATLGARFRALRVGIGFTLGFSLVFIFLGTSFGLLGVAAGPEYRSAITRVGGAVIILFGLLLVSGKDSLLFSGRMFGRAPYIARLPASIGAFAMGIAFGAGWTPCLGPILGAVLTLAASRATVGDAMGLMAVFSLGLAVPFLLVAFGFDIAGKAVARFAPRLWIISRLAGILLIVLGISLLLGKGNELTQTGYSLFEFLRIDWQALYRFF